MFIFKIFSLYNIIFYTTFFIFMVFLLFIAYKYIYLEQSIYILTNKINKLEIELNPSLNSSHLKSSMNENMRVADIIMNEIFNDNSSCDLTGSCPISPKVSINTNIQPAKSVINVEPPVEIFDLKKETEDKESVISVQTDTKKSLNKLNIDKLKVKCEERQLSTDGNKSQLVERILNHDNSKVLTEEIIDAE